MSNNELERNALDTLERLDTEAKESRQSQDARITTIEKRVDDFGKQLTRLSGAGRYPSGDVISPKCLGNA